MPKLKAAHIREQGQDMILFALDSSFGNKSTNDQQESLAELTDRANAAGLAGSAVIFWQSGGQTRFMGPPQWHPFLRGLSMRQVQASVNKEISWND